MSSYLVIFLLFLLQFIYFSVGKSYFEVPKVLTAEVVIAILFFIQFFSKQGLSLKNIPKSYLICFSLLFLLSLYHIFFDFSPTVLFGNAFRVQGTVLLWLLILFAMISSHIAIQKKFIPLLVFIVLLLQSISSLVLYGVGMDRAIGTIGEPNALAAEVVFLWPFLFFPKPKKLKQLLLAIVGSLLTFMVIFISGSRSGMIAIMIQAIFMLVYHFSHKLKVSLIIALILILLSYVFPFISQQDLYENRAEIWVSAITAGLSHPLLGGGFGNGEYALHKANVQLHNHLPGYYVDSAHNIFLDWFVQGGIIGFCILGFLLTMSYISFVKQKQILFIILLLGLVTTLSFNPVSVVSLISFWWLIGKGMADL